MVGAKLSEDFIELSVVFSILSQSIFSQLEIGLYGEIVRSLFSDFRVIFYPISDFF